MPSLFSSKKDSSSSKPSRSPLVGSSASDQYTGRATPEEQYRAQQQYRAAQGQQQQYAPPIQSPSQGAPQSFDRPPIDVAAAVNAGQRPPPPGTQIENRHSYQQQHLSQQEADRQALAAQQAAQTPVEEKRSIRARLFGHNSRDSVDQPQSGGKLPGRRESFRRKGSPHKSNPAEKGSSAYWSSRHSSNANLPVSHETDEDSHHQRYDPRAQQANLPVPAKDPSQPPQYYQQQYTQQQTPQDYGDYPPPPVLLPRVNTNQSSSSHGVQEIHSASEYSASSIQPTPNLLQEGFQQQPPPPQQIQQQQVYQPVSAGAPLTQPRTQPPPQDPSVRNSYYQQQAQRPQQDQAPPQQALRSATQGPPPPPHAQLPPQDQRFVPPPSGQPPAYQFPEIRSPQPIRGGLQVQSQAPPQGQLYPPRPPSQQHHGPPSPLNPAYQRQFERATSPGQPPSSSSEESVQHAGSGKYQQGPPPTSQAQPQSARTSSEMPSHGGQGSSRDSRYESAGQAGPAKLHRPPREDSELRRGTPPPRHGDVEEDAAQYDQLVKEHRELREKYQKVKKYYFEKEGQVHALQNTLAHQRLSQSRTSLDDSEYASRFSRLEGLISQLAFSIRKDWKTLPSWLQPGVNKDAITIGKQEMTVCGRAVISQWLIEELFDNYFHTDLERGLSMQLKQIQTTIRRYAPPFQNGEEEEALHSKIISWRLATIEGLQDDLRTAQAENNRQALTQELHNRLVATLSMHLQEPAPPDLTGGVGMIIELAIGIARHLPMESRDVVIEYFPPGSTINSDLMKIESSGIPALANPMADLPDTQADRASLRSTTSDLKDTATGPEDIVPGTNTSPAGQSAGAKDDKKAKGMLGGLMGTRKPPPATAAGKLPGANSSQASLPQQPPGSSGKDERQEPRVRIAAGLSVHVRGRNVLSKSSVYTVGG